MAARWNGVSFTLRETLYMVFTFTGEKDSDAAGASRHLAILRYLRGYPRRGESIESI